MGDEVQAIKAGLLEVADLVVVNKGDKPGAQRTAAQLRAMLVEGAAAAAPARDRTGATLAGDGPRPRPRPKRPEVLVTTAATGAGVPELLDALDRRQAAVDDRTASESRLARAEAQVWAIVADRIRDRLHEEQVRGDTRETLAAVAGHRLDPYAAADALLARVLDDDRPAGR
jgi:LAO/AO transport system kinase